MKAYLINLDRSPERLTEADAQLRAAGVAYERVPAVDGRALGRAGLRGRVSRFRFFLVHGRLPTPGEVACACSHLEAYRRLLASGEGAALVFEDDAALDPDAFRNALARVEARFDPATPELFLLCDHEGADKAEAIVPAGDACFAECYVVTAAAARRLLALNDPVRAATDAWAHWAARGVAVLKVLPAACRQRGVGSDINPGWRPKRRARWGWYVALWRARLALGHALDWLIWRLAGR